MKNLVRNAISLSATLALFLGLAAAPAFSQTGSLEGKVIGADGKPVGKDAALIRIVRTDIKGNYQVKTNKKGEYFHAGLPLGTYDVTCEVDGKPVDSMKGVRMRLGDPLPINFDLSVIAKKQADAQKAVETGEITKEMARDMSPEQKAALEKRAKEQSETMKKNKELNDAFNGGMEAMKANNFQGAVDSLEKAATMDQKQHVIYGQLAEAYAGVAKSKTGAEKDAANLKSIENFQKAIELKPDDASYYNNYGLALARGGKFAEAQEALNKAAALDPAGAGRYYYNLGALMVNAGQNEAAGEVFKKAIAADPNYADAHYQYGIYLTGKAIVDNKTGKMTFPEGTREAFEKYMELKPDGQFAASAKGMIETMGGTVQTNYVNPDAKKTAAPANKKKKN
ncbi:tetratricopeptide repeat protein [Bryobacter aggregatus]|uniref:tetratricopeptide repeat protein n=1 Tax=Bryobacter aggregatus TaxID=360054 RepID=UPI0009B5C285|nr:tetratricopeptide repeat protein [Bryobacter aggregatus]